MSAVSRSAASRSWAGVWPVRSKCSSCSGVDALLLGRRRRAACRRPARRRGVWRESGSWLVARSRLSSRRSSSSTVDRTAGPARARSRSARSRCQPNGVWTGALTAPCGQRQGGLSRTSGRSPLASGPSSERSTLASFSAAATCVKLCPAGDHLGRALDRRLVGGEQLLDLPLLRRAVLVEPAHRRRRAGRRR